MNQTTIRSFNEQEYTPEEAAAWLLELDNRTKSTQTGYNSIDELATSVKALLGNQVTGFITRKTLAEIQALTGDVNTAYFVLNDTTTPANNGTWGFDGTVYFQAAKTVNSSAFDAANNTAPATQKSTADYVATLRGGTVTSGETKSVSGGIVFNKLLDNNFTNLTFTSTKAYTPTSWAISSNQGSVVGNTVTIKANGIQAKLTYDNTVIVGNKYIAIVQIENLSLLHANATGLKLVNYSQSLIDIKPSDNNNFYYATFTATTTGAIQLAVTGSVNSSSTVPVGTDLVSFYSFVIGIVDWSEENEELFATIQDNYTGGKFKFNTVSKALTSDVATTAKTVEGQELLAEKSYTRNAFVLKNSLDGYVMQVYNKALIENSLYTTSLEFVPVSAGDILTTVMNYGEGSVVIGYFSDTNLDSWISGDYFTATSLKKTVPSNGAKYVRASCQKANKYHKLININSTDRSYINGGKYLDSSLVIGLKSMFTNRNWYSDGDSITAQQTWQPIVTNKFGLDWKNVGIGGQKYSSSLGFWATSFDETNNIAKTGFGIDGDYYIHTDAEFVTIMGGVNDWAQNIPIGTQDSTDINTLMGGFNKYIELYYAKFPTIPLIVMSPTLAYKPSGDFVGWENNLGLSCYDYADAIEQRCRTLGIPYVDIIRNYGVTKVNHLTYTPDYAHPNSLGGQKVAGVLMGYMNSIDSLNGGVTHSTLGYNLVSNGTFADDTIWGKMAWTISGGKAYINGAASVQSLTQNIGIEIGKKYKISYRILDYVAGTVKVGLGGYIATARTSNGYFTDILEVTSAANPFVVVSAQTGFNGSVDNIIVQEILD